MIQDFHYLQKYYNDILNLVQSLVWVELNFLANVKKDAVYITDVSTT